MMKLLVAFGLVAIIFVTALTTVEGEACICTQEFKPVCGSNGKTYSNRCGLECEAKKDPTITFSHDGICEEKPPGGHKAEPAGGTVAGPNDFLIALAAFFFISYLGAKFMM